MHAGKLLARLGTGLPAPDTEGLLCVRAAPWFIGLALLLLRREGIEARLTPRGDGSYEMQVRRRQAEPAR